MAYPTVSAAYGFRPVNLLGGQVYAGSTRQMAIASGHATNIFFGDCVIMSTNGCINNNTVTNTGTAIVGIFMGCSYINSSGQRVYGQYYPATITQAVDSANGTIAYIADDPDLVMKVAIQSAADASPRLRVRVLVVVRRIVPRWLVVTSISSTKRQKAARRLVMVRKVLQTLVWPPLRFLSKSSTLFPIPRLLLARSWKFWFLGTNSPICIATQLRWRKGVNHGYFTRTAT